MPAKHHTPMPLVDERVGLAIDPVHVSAVAVSPVPVSPVPVSAVAADGDERGATLVEYTLVLVLVVIAMIGGVELLTDSGADLLNDVSADIAAPREYRNIVIETPVAPPPPYVPTTLPSTILTWVDRPVATPEGCLKEAGAAFTIVACTNPNVTLLNGLSDDGVYTEIGLVDGSKCLSGDASGPSPVVSLQPCGGSGQQWLETSASGSSVTYQHQDSGLCIQTIVPAAPDPLTMAACDGSSGQTIEVKF